METPTGSGPGTPSTKSANRSSLRMDEKYKRLKAKYKDLLSQNIQLQSRVSELEKKLSAYEPIKKETENLEKAEENEEVGIRVSRSTKRVGVRSKRSVSVGRRGSKSAVKRNQWIDDKDKPQDDSFGKLPVPGLNFREIVESTPPTSTDDRSEGGSRKSRKMIKAGPTGVENLQELIKVEENRRINLRGNPNIKQLTKSRSHESFQELVNEWQEHQKSKSPKGTTPPSSSISIGSRGTDSNQSAPLPAATPPPASLHSHSANLSLKGSLPNSDLPDNSPPPRTERLVISFEELEHYKALINLNFDQVKLENNKKAEYMRLQALRELVTTEIDYVRDLELIVKYWLNPLREKNIVKAEQVMQMFGNIEIILNVNQELMTRMVATVLRHSKCPLPSSSDTFVSLTHSGGSGTSYAPTGDSDLLNCSIGNIFSSLSSYLKVYSTFVANQDTFLSTYEHTRKHNSHFVAFLQVNQVRAELRGLSLFDFIIKPMQRICKYPLLLKEIVAHTSPSHSDFDNLQKALVSLETVTLSVNNGRKQFENQRKIVEIAEKLQGLEMSELVGPSRKFITESDVIFLSKGKAKQRRFFLFNDLLVLSKVINKKKDIANFKEKIPLHFIVCSDIKQTDSPTDPKYRYSFEITRMDKKKKYLVSVEKEESKFLWIESIMAYHSELVSSDIKKASLLGSGGNHPN